MRPVATLLLALILAGPMTTAWAIDCEQSDVNVEMRRLMGGSENLCQTYGGQVMLVVNVASQCGFTPQYEALEQTYRNYRERGFVVLGFPSGDFGGQEYDDEAQIAKFCKVNFGVSFPMFGKSAVKGDDANPLFRTLTDKTGQAPGWNFNKYLVGRDGRVIKHFPSGTAPDSAELRAAINAALDAAARTVSAR